MADIELPNCFEPYLRYAIATDFKYFGSFDEEGFKLFLLVEFIDVKHAEQFGGEMDDHNHPHDPPGIEFGPSDPASRFTTMRGFKAAVGPSTFQSWIDHVSRVELSLPVKPTTAELVKRADLRDRTASKYPPTEVLIGQIDDGCPFAATRFTKFISSVATGTRVRGIWDQNPGRNPISPDPTKVFGEFLTDFHYGLEFRRDSDPPGAGIRQIGLDEWIELHTTNTDLVDEDDCYADAHFKTLKRHRSHGGHVMDTLAGRVPVSSRIGRQDPPSWQPDSGPAATADIVFVQFSEACLRDATGVWLKSYVVDGIYYILSFVDPTKTKNIVVNVSYGPTTGPHDGTAELEDALTDLVTIFDGTHGKPKLDVFLAVGNSYLSDGHLFFENKTTQPVHAEWIWRIPPDNSVLCFAEVWMSASAASGVVVTLTSPSGLISTSVTGPIPPPPGIPFPSYTGAYAPRTWGSNTMWLLTIEPTIAGPGFVPEHGDWTIRVDYIGVNANVHAYVARTDPNFDVHSGARSSRFVDPQWEESLSAEESLEYADGEFDLTGSRIKTHGTLNGIATAQEPSVHVAGGYILSNGRKSSYASAGPARGGPREGPDYVLPCDESYALQGILGGGNRSGGVFRLIGTSVAAPQLARHFANADGGVAFPMATDVPTDPSEVEKRGGGDLPPP